MKLYWFSDEDGHFWLVVAAENEERAWELLAREQYTEEGEKMTLEETKKNMQLNAVTVIGEKEGEVASIFPLECGFTISEEPDGELSSLCGF